MSKDFTIDLDRPLTMMIPSPVVERYRPNDLSALEAAAAGDVLKMEAALRCGAAYVEPGPETIRSPWPRSVYRIAAAAGHIDTAVAAVEWAGRNPMIEAAISDAGLGSPGRAADTMPMLWPEVARRDHRIGLSVDRVMVGLVTERQEDLPEGTAARLLDNFLLRNGPPRWRHRDLFSVLMMRLRDPELAGILLNRRAIPGPEAIISVQSMIDAETDPGRRTAWQHALEVIKKANPPPPPVVIVEEVGDTQEAEDALQP